MSTKKKLVVIDGMAYAFRAFYAVTLMSNSKGAPTNAIFGFINSMRRAQRDHKPDYVAVAFDSPGGSFRDEMLKEYKAHRDAPPEDLVSQFSEIEKLVELMGWPLLKKSRFEADDIMATLTTAALKKNAEVILMTSDKDIFQLVSDKVKVLRESPKGPILYGPKEVKERYGVGPELIGDLLGLMGDSSDNIPGVPGVGEKTAAKLLQEYGSIEAVLKAAPKMKEGKLRDNLIQFADQARLSRKLAELDDKVAVEKNLDKFVPKGPQPGLVEKLKEWEFRNLIVEYSKKAAEAGVEVKEEPVKAVSKKDRVKVSEAKAGAEAIRRAGFKAKEPCGAFLQGQGPWTLALAQGANAVCIPCATAQELRDTLEPLQCAVFYDSKAVQRIFVKEGLGTLEGMLDLSVGAYLVNSTRPARDLAETAGILGLDAPELPQPGQELFEPPKEDLAKLASFSARLGEELLKRMKKDGLEKLYYELEGPLILVLAVMEVQGLKVDGKALEELDKECQAKMKKLEKKAMQLAGRDFNLNSPSQLAKVLFEDLKIPHQKKTKTGYSTDNEVLESIEHPLAAVALENRMLAKLSGTYLQALPKLVDSEGLLRTTWNQTIAATGRLSSTDPNLQNIPIRTELGMQVRKAFVPRKRGDLILSADYSQIELRVLAHYCEDPVLMKAFKEDLDIHKETAAKIFGVKPEAVTSEMRSRAKVINFGVLYGMGPFRLSREFNVTVKEAKEFIEQYFGRFPNVLDFLESCKEETRKKGYASTILGRRRYIPEIHSANRVLREAGERVSTNMPIQGSAADLIKKAMLDVQALLDKKKAKSRMIMQVHDELVFDMDKSEASWLPNEVSRMMKNALKLKCPLDVGLGSGKSWFEAKS